MARLRATLPPGVVPVAHGCVESFPCVPDAGGTPDMRNRRIEVFLFAEQVLPPPAADNSGPRSRDYPRWQRTIIKQVELSARRQTHFLFSV